MVLITQSRVMCRIRTLSGIVTREALTRQKKQGNLRDRGRKVNKFWLAAAFFGGGAVATAVAGDGRFSEKFGTPKYPRWNYHWDDAWRPDTAPQGGQPTNSWLVEFLERLQKARQSPLDPVVSDVRSTRQLILVRHGQYKDVGGPDDTTQGLTDLGKEQAARAGEYLAELLKGKKVRAVFHSDMLRARETANIIATYLPNVPALQDPNLAEGVPEIPDPLHPTFQPSNLDIEIGHARIESAFQKYFFRAPPPALDATEDEDTFDILVCHGNVIRYMFCRALQFSPSAWLRLATYHCGITWLSIDHRGYVSAREFGNVGFLPPSKVTYF